MNTQDNPRGVLHEGTPSSTADIDALKQQIQEMQLLSELEFSKNSYYYQKSLMNRPDKYMDIRTRVITIFYNNRGCYDYRRIHGMLQREGVHISEKVVRRIMQGKRAIRRETINPQ